MAADPEALVGVRLLGGFRIEAGGAALEERDWRLRKAAALVKLLCLSPGRRRQRDELLEILWPELAPEAAANNLHYALHVARRTLEGAFPEAIRWLHARAGVVELRPDCGVVVDVAEFEAAATAAEGSSEAALCAAAIERYAGDLLPNDLYEDWTVGRREALRDRYHALLTRKARLHEARGEHEAAAQTLSLSLVSNPASEEAHAALMRLYALAGQRDQALRQFQQLREALRRELDAEPDAATQRLYEEIFSGRLSAPTARAAAQGQREAAPRRHNLPYALTTFIGRRAELAELPELLAEHRLVTLAGTGGCGKTRLAVEVGHALAERMADGVWLVELASLSDGRLVAQAVAAAIGVVEEPGRALLETLCRQLGDRELLLLLDNCEHVAAEAAEVVAAVLRAAPRLRVLATSRAPLGIFGEVVRRVPSLAVPVAEETEAGEDAAEAEETEAVRLFVDRARRVRPGFRLDGHSARAVKQICRRLDGLPLAIELAAARVDAVAVWEIAERLDDCYQLLTNGGRTAPARHQTLRAAVDWSYVLLSEGEQALFNELSVFGGTFTLEAAEHVCGGGGWDVLTLIVQLVGRSLVMPVEAGQERLRYRLLEPLRQYAAERLRETGGADAAQRRHTHFFASEAAGAEEGLSGPDQVAWLERLEAEHDNYRVALRWSLGNEDDATAAVGIRLAASLARFWQVRSHLEEGWGWLEQAMGRSERLAHLETAERARLLGEAGGVALARGEYARAAALQEKRLWLCQAAADTRGMGWSLLGLGDAAYAQGDLLAAPLYEAALDHLREAADQRGIATAYGNLGQVARRQGNYGYAEGLCRQSLRVYEELGDRRQVALALAALGHVARGCGAEETAAGYYAQSLAHAHALGARRDMAGALEGLAATLGPRGQAETAVVLLGGAEALRESSGAPRSEVEAEEHLRTVETVRLALSEDEYEAARRRGAMLPAEELVALALKGAPPLSEPAPIQLPVADADSDRDAQARDAQVNAVTVG